MPILIPQVGMPNRYYYYNNSRGSSNCGNNNCGNCLSALYLSILQLTLLALHTFKALWQFFLSAPGRRRRRRRRSKRCGRGRRRGRRLFVCHLRPTPKPRLQQQPQPQLQHSCLPNLLPCGPSWKPAVQFSMAQQFSFFLMAAFPFRSCRQRRRRRRSRHRRRLQVLLYFQLSYSFFSQLTESWHQFLFNFIIFIFIFTAPALKSIIVFMSTF